MPRCVPPPAGCSAQRRVDPFRSDPGGDPRQPSGQRGGRGRGAVGLEEEDEQRPPPPPEQPSPAECLVFSVQVGLAVAVDASVRASIAQSIPY